MGVKIPKIDPVTSPSITTKELLISLEELKGFQLNLFQYRRKALNEYQIQHELALGEKVCLENEICLVLNSYHGKELANKFLEST